MCYRLCLLFKETEIHVSENPSGLQIGPDDGHRNLLVSRNDDGPKYPRFYVRAMASLLRGEAKARH